MLEIYKSYCQLPDLSNAQTLLESIVNFDMASYKSVCDELYNVYNSYKYESTDIYSMYTGGTTTGVSKKYSFGPNSMFWINQITRNIEATHQDSLHITYSYTNGLRETCVRTHPSNLSGHIVVPFLRDTLINDIKDFFINHPDNYTIHSTPNVFHYLNSCKSFQDFMIENKEKYTIVTTGWEGFYKRKKMVDAGVRINDCMINWYDGFNFYTCKYGHKHFLPFFVPSKNGFCNLLNLSFEPDDVEDICTFTESFMCPCGKTTWKYNFIPHVKTAIVGSNGCVFSTDLAEQLDSLYLNLQFVQDPDTNVVQVCYHTAENISENDKNVITNFFDKEGLSVMFCDHLYYILGDLKLNQFGKMITFYRNINHVEGQYFYNDTKRYVHI